MDGNTENQSSRLYVVCSNCGYEADCSENDKEIICPSCGETIPAEQIVAARRNLQNSNPEFVMEQQKLIRYSGKASRVIVPKTVNEISPRAFAGCESLQEVSFPDMINRIPQSAFEGCVNLQKVTLPENLYRIDANAFKGCTGLKEIQLPASIRIIEDGAFSGVNSLNYRTLFKNNAHYGTALKIEDAQLAKQYQTVLKAKGKTDEKPKRKIPAFVYAIAAAVLLIGGFFIKKEMDFSAQIKLAESYVRSGSYEKGISAYERALEIKNQDRDAQSAMKQAYKSWGDSLLADGRYEEAIEKYSYNQDLLNYAVDAYLEWADSYAETSDFDGAVKILEKGKENLSYQSYAESNRINDMIEDLEYKAVLKEKLLAIAQNVDDENFEAGLKQLDELNNDSSQIDHLLYGHSPFIIDVEQGAYSKIGIRYAFTSGYSIYYGDYSGTTRQGEGYYLYRWDDSKESNSFEYCFGKWENDKPNGKQSIYKWSYTGSKLERNDVYTINVIDGLYDGEMVKVNKITGVTFKGEFNDGIVKVLGEETDSDGKTYKVILYSSDKSHYSFYTDESSYDRKHFIFGF